MRPLRGTTRFQMPATGFGKTPVRLRGPLKTYSRLRRIEPEVIVGQWLTALPVVVMMLQHYTRFVPFPECAPAHSADFAGHPTNSSVHAEWVSSVTSPG